MSQVDLTITAILISIFYVTGWLGIWAVRARTNCLIKIAVVSGIFAPLLYAEAYEPSLTLLLQIATVMFFLRFFARERFDDRDATSHFATGNTKRKWTLSEVMVLVLLLAGLLAIGIRMPPLTWYAWTSMFVIGIGLGLIVGIAAAANHRRFCWQTLLAIPSLAIAIAVPIKSLDGFVPSLRDNGTWPPVGFPGIRFFEIRNDESPVLVWWFVCVGLSLAIHASQFLLTFDFERSRKTATTTHNHRQLKILRWFGFSTFLALSLPALAVFGILIKPATSVPQEQLENNEYEHIVEVATRIADSEFSQINGNWQVVDEQRLSAAIDQMSGDFHTLRLALMRPTQVRLDDDFEYLRSETIRAFRTTARALLANGRLHMMRDDSKTANESYLAAVRLGVVVRRGGLFVDQFLGMSCTGTGMSQLYQNRDNYSQTDCETASQRLFALSREIALETNDNFNERDLAWTQATMGWHGRLQQFVWRPTQPSPQDSEIPYQTGYLRELALLRLLATDFALRAHFLHQQRWPASLTDLAMVSLHSSDLIDPFDKAGRNLRYRRTPDGYVLYSVGPNRVDDGGAAPKPSAQIPERTSDLLLEHSLGK